MSCDWDIHCKTCNEDMGISDANHADDEMRAIIKAADYIAQIQLLSKHLPDVLELEIRCWRGNGGFKAEFLLKHSGHELVPKDEYGRLG